MTEKEIIEHCYNEQGGFDRMLRIVLDLAKEHGAKFDPEPVKLPEITLDGYKSRLVAGTELLTHTELAEVVRRCNDWDTVLHLLRGVQIGKTTLSRVIAGMEGRRPFPS